MAEYHGGISNNSLASKAWNNLPVLDLEPAEMTFTTQLPGCLGDGERSCLAIAIPRRGWIASDDRKARLVAIQYGIHVTGTIGVFYTAIENGILEKRLANTLLKKMIGAGYRSPLNDLGQL